MKKSPSKTTPKSKAPAKRKRTPKVKTHSPEEIRLMFEEELKKRYWSEKELAFLLPKLAKTATSYELASAIDEHSAVTEKQIIRLIHIFDDMQERAVGIKCFAMNGLISEGEQIIKSKETGFARDVAIIKACQQLMTFDIASYAKLLDFATSLNETQAAGNLAIAIAEEKTAHALLTEIALATIYEKAG